MTLFASVRLVRQLNAMINDAVEPGRAATAVQGADVAHHLLDPDGVSGLDETRSTTLVDALPRLVALESQGWALALPVPGRLGILRGPAALNRAALDAGSAVVGLTGGAALVPVPVGPAVQWRLHPAERAAPPPTAYEAERALSEAVIHAGSALARLDAASGPRPVDLVDLGPAPGSPPRQRAAADRAARLLAACEQALDHDGATLSSYEVATRRRELEVVREAAREALVAAVSWQPSRSRVP